MQVGNSKYYFYTLSVNGEAERHGGNYAEDYLTDLLHARALEFLDSRDTEKPFLLVVAPPASHAPFTPAPQYRDRFPNLTAPRLPSFNVDSGDTKHWLTRQGDRALRCSDHVLYLEQGPTTSRVASSSRVPAGGPLSAGAVAEVDAVFRDRWRTLLSVDDLVAGLVARLEQEQLLDTTYILYTRCHPAPGYHSHHLHLQ